MPQALTYFLLNLEPDLGVGGIVVPLRGIVTVLPFPPLGPTITYLPPFGASMPETNAIGNLLFNISTLDGRVLASILATIGIPVKKNIQYLHFVYFLTTICCGFRKFLRIYRISVITSKPEFFTPAYFIPPNLKNILNIQEKTDILLEYCLMWGGMPSRMVGV